MGKRRVRSRAAAARRAIAINRGLRVVNEDPLNLIGKVLLKRYRVQKYLGGGGFGTVYAVYDHDLGDDMALKIPKDSSLNDAIIREARKLYRLAKRPTARYVVRFFTLEEISGRQVLLMEYCKGRSLRDRIRKNALRQVPLDPVLTCQIVSQVSQGLEEAHALKYVHRDVKPENIFLSEEAPAFGDAKIGDFGIAAILETSRAETTIGTLMYMAPEAVKGEGSDLRSDIYSLGVTMYELLVGAAPFDTKLSRLELPKAIARGECTPISRYSHVDRRLQAIVQKAMNTDPDKRYQRTADMTGAVVGVHVDLAVDAVLAGSETLSAQQVEQQLADLCEQFPTSRRPWVERARQLGRRGMTEEAGEVLQRAIARVGDDPKLLFLLAQNRAASGNRLQAVGILSDALSESAVRQHKGREGTLSAKEVATAKRLLAAWRRSAADSGHQPDHRKIRPSRCVSHLEEERSGDPTAPD
jgi:serine/threonine protein kinase